MNTLNDIQEAITMSINPVEEILDDLVIEDMEISYNDNILALIDYLDTALDYLKDARNKVEDLIGMIPTPDLIDLVLSVVIDHSGISTDEVAMMVSVDPMTAADALASLYYKHEIERKIDRDGTVRWYDPEQPR